MLILTLSLFIFFFLELAYFKIADYFNIIDKPNLRSSHTVQTIRGGGIIFPLSVIAAGIAFEQLRTQEYIYFTSGLILISFISFLDDCFTIKNSIRIILHFISVFLLLLATNLISLEWYWLIGAFILIVGIINAYNFMDGINGITVLYSLIALLTIYYINNYKILIIDQDFFLTVTASFLVFAFFNVRKTARSFAGDVGSVSAAFIISFLIVLLIIKTQNIVWILLLSVYGIDSILTIIFRLIRKENIFDAHRSHFYQYLANERKIAHIKVAAIYAIFQVILNLTLIHNQQLSMVTSLFILYITLYIILRLSMEGKNRLFIKYDIKKA